VVNPATGRHDSYRFGICPDLAAADTQTADNETLTPEVIRVRIPVVQLWEEMKPRPGRKSRREHFTC
jgi:hypothetical protein